LNGYLFTADTKQNFSPWLADLSLGRMKVEHSSQKTISHDEINNLPLKSFQGKIVLITEAKDLLKAFKEIQEHDVVGFDTETKPAFVKGQIHKVSLLQLAIPNKVFLIRLNFTGFDADVTKFLENEKILKAGVGIRDDIKFLHRLGKFTAGGFTELSSMARDAGLEVESVKKLTALLLGFRISKGAQTSNWEAPTLNEKQIMYAATDAWVCLEIFKKLRGEKSIRTK
jgi:ribonuclease D